MSNQLALDAIGDPLQRCIFERLAERLAAVGELAATLPIGRPAVSRHLRALSGAGLVQHSSRDTRNLYVLSSEGRGEIQQWLVSVWDSVLGSFAANVDAVQTRERTSR